MIITKKALLRRTVLRGLGVAVGFPLLDAMIPALTATRLTAANPTRRLGVVYVPNGMNLEQWTPAADGAAFELTPTLTAMAPFRESMLVLSGFANKEAQPADEGTGDHSRAQATFLTGVRPHKTEGPDIRAGISMDQIAARELGRHTQLASLELTLETNDLVGTCDFGYSCAYTGTLAWSNATTPLPMEINPRAVFERLFGDSDTTDVRARAARMQEVRSILDSVTDDLAHFQRGLGTGDRAKVGEYVEAIRDVERRIQNAEAQRDQELPLVEQPRGVPATFEAHAMLMFDLLALAYQSDLTRVATFLVGREISTRTYPEIGVPEPHHPVSHHQDRPEQLLKLAKINAFHMKLFVHFLEKLQSTADGDGSLLDHSIILYGSGMGNSNLHLHRDLPILVIGKGAGRILGGRHVRFAPGTPLANLHVTLLDKMGIPVERFGDSTGRLDAATGI